MSDILVLKKLGEIYTSGGTYTEEGGVGKAGVPFRFFVAEGGFRFQGGIRRSRTIFDLREGQKGNLWQEKEASHTAGCSDRDLRVKDVFAENEG